MAIGKLTSATCAGIVRLAWNDPGYKARLVADPTGTVAAAGAQLPAGVTVKLVEDTDKLLHLVLPLRPGADDLDDEALELVAGGVSHIARGQASFGCATQGQ